ncbi:MAG TPA: hypothetical protein ENK04_09935 [Gammaproteobacteria bacterium]|nr:hypothetical protein [Gammaproteobacteria bacterium]
MPLVFKETLTLQPIPMSRQLAARQASLIQRRLAASGSLARIKAEALGAINKASPDDPPSEIKRLRLLYQSVYTQQELTMFVDSSLAELGFSE